MNDNDIFARLRQIAEEQLAKAPAAPAAPASAAAAPSGAVRFDELLGTAPQAETDSADADADPLP